MDKTQQEPEKQRLPGNIPRGTILITQKEKVLQELPHEVGTQVLAPQAIKISTPRGIISLESLTPLTLKQILVEIDEETIVSAYLNISYKANPLESSRKTNLTYIILESPPLDSSRKKLLATAALLQAVQLANIIIPNHRPIYEVWYQYMETPQPPPLEIFRKTRLNIASQIVSHYLLANDQAIQRMKNYGFDEQELELISRYYEVRSKILKYQLLQILVRDCSTYSRTCLDYIAKNSDELRNEAMSLQRYRFPNSADHEKLLNIIETRVQDLAEEIRSLQFSNERKDT